MHGSSFGLCVEACGLRLCFRAEFGRRKHGSSLWDFALALFRVEGLSDQLRVDCRFRDSN